MDTINTILVITGCINPNPNQRHLVFYEITKRLEQYIESIKYYIEKTVFTKIVFCENSGYQCREADILIEYAKQHNKILEWLSFKGNDSLLVKYGNKGIGEDEIMNYICENSKLYENALQLAKVTGRLILTNINQLMEDANISYDYFYRDLFRGKSAKSVDTRFYIVTKKTYESKLRNCYIRIGNYNKCYEMAFYSLLHPHYHQLREYLHFEGISAGNGYNYSEIRTNRIKIYDFLCRHNLFNTCFPIINFVNRIYNKYQRIAYNKDNF